jgi:hypothetical protein
MMERNDQKSHETFSSVPLSAPISEKNSGEDTIATSPDQSSLSTALETTQDVQTTQQTSASELEREGPARELKGIKWIICVLSIFSSVFLYALDNTIVATIQPSIIDAFGHLEKLPWVSVAFQVTCVALNLTWYVWLHALKV